MAATKTFRAWIKIQASRMMGEKSPEEIVDKMMEEKNLRIEIKDNKNRWIEENL